MTSASSIAKPWSSDAVRQGVVADGAVDVGDRAARPAHDVVVVVADPRLVARHRAGRLDAPHQTRAGQRPQHVVDGLVGHLARSARTAPMIESVSACGCSYTAVSTATRGRVTRRAAPRSICSKSKVVGTPQNLPLFWNQSRIQGSSAHSSKGASQMGVQLAGSTAGWVGPSGAAFDTLEACSVRRGPTTSRA